MTKLSSSEITGLSNLLMGTNHGRCATVSKTAKRFIDQMVAARPETGAAEADAVLDEVNHAAALAHLARVLTPKPAEAPAPAKPAKAPRVTKGKAAPTPAGEAKVSKQDQFLALMRRPEGVSISEAVVAMGWQAHTVRGAVAGAIKVKLGLTPTATKEEGRGTVYRLPAAEARA